MMQILSTGVELQVNDVRTNMELGWTLEDFAPYCIMREYAIIRVTYKPQALESIWHVRYRVYYCNT